MDQARWYRLCTRVVVSISVVVFSLGLLFLGLSGG